MSINFETISEKIRTKSLKPIGRGSGRTVFALDEKSVVKAARNPRGIAQNIAEFDIFSRTKSPILAKIFGISEDGRFLVMERALPAYSMSEIYPHFSVQSSRALLKLPELKELSHNFGLILPDLGRAANWGIIEGKPKILDFGFTKLVKKRYYSFI